MKTIVSIIQSDKIFNFIENNKLKVIFLDIIDNLSYKLTYDELFVHKDIHHICVDERIYFWYLINKKFYVIFTIVKNDHHDNVCLILDVVDKKIIRNNKEVTLKDVAEALASPIKKILNNRPPLGMDSISTCVPVYDLNEEDLKEEDLKEDSVDDEVEESWNFWKDIILNPDGSINIEQLKKELSDFYFIMNEVPKVYDSVTGGRMSKISYHASDVIAESEDYYTGIYRERVDEFLSAMKDGGYINKNSYDNLVNEVNKYI